MHRERLHTVILMENSGKLKIPVCGGALLLSASGNISKVSVTFPIKGNFYFLAGPVVSFLQQHNVLPLKDNPVVISISSIISIFHKLSFHD